MKKIAFNAKSCIAGLSMMLISSLMMTSCSKTETATDETAVVEQTTETTEQAPSINIRYIDGDSISANYNLAKDLQDLYLRSVSKMQQAERSKQAELQQFGSQIEQKVRNNSYLSEDSYKADMNKFNQMQQNAQKHLADLQSSTEQELVRQQQELNDSIEAFIKEYNKTKGYDAILYKAAGVYFNPALDITNEVVAGLNARYNKVKESK